MKLLRSLFLTSALLLAITGCSSGADVTATATTNPDSGPAVTLVTLGGSETIGDSLEDPLRDSWPQLLYRSSLPRRAVFVNLATSRTSADEALRDQLPAALALKPTIATVWFGVAAAFRQTPVETFRADLSQIVEQLQTAGAKVVVVIGPTPDLSGAPLDTEIDLAPLNEASAEVAKSLGAELVDLTGQEVRAATAQQEVANQIAAAIGTIR